MLHTHTLYHKDVESSSSSTQSSTHSTPPPVFPPVQNGHTRSHVNSLPQKSSDYRHKSAPPEAVSLSNSVVSTLTVNNKLSHTTNHDNISKPRPLTITQVPKDTTGPSGSPHSPNMRMASRHLSGFIERQKSKESSSSPSPQQTNSLTFPSVVVDGSDVSNESEDTSRTLLPCKTSNAQPLNVDSITSDLTPTNGDFGTLTSADSAFSELDGGGMSKPHVSNSDSFSFENFGGFDTRESPPRTFAENLKFVDSSNDSQYGSGERQVSKAQVVYRPIDVSNTADITMIPGSGFFDASQSQAENIEVGLLQRIAAEPVVTTSKDLDRKSREKSPKDSKKSASKPSKGFGLFKRNAKAKAIEEEAEGEDFVGDDDDTPKIKPKFAKKERESKSSSPRLSSSGESLNNNSPAQAKPKKRSASISQPLDSASPFASSGKPPLPTSAMSKLNKGKKGFYSFREEKAKSPDFKTSLPDLASSPDNSRDSTLSPDSHISSSSDNKASDKKPSLRKRISQSLRDLVGKESPSSTSKSSWKFSEEKNPQSPVALLGYRPINEHLPTSISETQVSSLSNFDRDSLHEDTELLPRVDSMVELKPKYEERGIDVVIVPPTAKDKKDSGTDSEEYHTASESESSTGLAATSIQMLNSPTGLSQEFGYAPRKKNAADSASSRKPLNPSSSGSKGSTEESKNTSNLKAGAVVSGKGTRKTSTPATVKTSSPKSTKKLAGKTPVTVVSKKVPSPQISPRSSQRTATATTGLVKKTTPSSSPRSSLRTSTTTASKSPLSSPRSSLRAGVSTTTPLAKKTTPSSSPRSSHKITIKTGTSSAVKKSSTPLSTQPTSTSQLTKKTTPTNSPRSSQRLSASTSSKSSSSDSPKSSRKSITRAVPGKTGSPSASPRSSQRLSAGSSTKSSPSDSPRSSKISITRAVPGKTGSPSASPRSSQRLSKTTSPSVSPRSSQRLSKTTSPSVSPRSSQRLSKTTSPSVSPRSSQRLGKVGTSSSPPKSPPKSSPLPARKAPLPPSNTASKKTSSPAIASPLLKKKQSTTPLNKPSAPKLTKNSLDPACAEGAPSQDSFSRFTRGRTPIKVKNTNETPEERTKRLKEHRKSESLGLRGTSASKKDAARRATVLVNPLTVTPTEPQPQNPNIISPTTPGGTKKRKFGLTVAPPIEELIIEEARVPSKSTEHMTELVAKSAADISMDVDSLLSAVGKKLDLLTVSPEQSKPETSLSSVTSTESAAAKPDMESCVDSRPPPPSLASMEASVFETTPLHSRDSSIDIDTFLEQAAQQEALEKQKASTKQKETAKKKDPLPKKKTSAPPTTTKSILHTKSESQIKNFTSALPPRPPLSKQSSDAPTKQSTLEKKTSAMGTTRPRQVLVSDSTAAKSLQSSIRRTPAAKSNLTTTSSSVSSSLSKSSTGSLKRQPKTSTSLRPGATSTLSARSSMRASSRARKSSIGADPLHGVKSTGAKSKDSTLSRIGDRNMKSRSSTHMRPGSALNASRRGSVPVSSTSLSQDTAPTRKVSAITSPSRHSLKKMHSSGDILPRKVKPGASATLTRSSNAGVYSSIRKSGKFNTLKTSRSTSIAGLSRTSESMSMRRTSSGGRKTSTPSSTLTRKATSASSVTAPARKGTLKRTGSGGEVFAAFDHISAQAQGSL